MAAIKESSTVQINKQITQAQCPVTYLMERMGGYWKPIVIYHLTTGNKRYSEIRRAIPAITEKVLIQQLKQLEEDQLIIREAKPVVPPHVTYKLSSSGKELAPVIEAMSTWAFKDMKSRSRKKN